MILALDCATAFGSVALVRDSDDREVVREVTFPAPRGRGGALFSVLEDILSEAEELIAVVAGTGPGSYNGIRAALAAAWGIAKARGIPLIGVSSLLGVAEGNYLTVGDARRGQYYFARVQDGSFKEEPALYSQAEILRKVGQGIPAALVAPDLSGEWPIFVPEPIGFLPEALVCGPQAARFARRVSLLSKSTDLPEPLYLKPAHITGPLEGR